ncbi:NADH-quinone oxidoreductase subunit A [Mucilaginibacter agri]|uniref:NADH-quinone oxidoreductase subunit A n=1 Tax=Mucilaginibacter agri TaxID=2695265 RepID=A0A966DT59_9SPHI|nr:NADH-quinone oxidoreductase subunit A [Mucilaginibacter agri]NCD68977.1 NAD(P)H-quinone oxidoreductase subunit 3 [Mucilaginibacter agri]
MGEVAQISEFGKILIFLIIGIVMTGAAFFANKLVAPNNPNPEKLTSYECGEEPTGNAWLPFNSRFYVIALIFLLFDVEMMFIFPWATVFGDKQIAAVDSRWTVLSMVEMFVFVGILILGLVYVWIKGDLAWIKPNPITPKVDVNIPASVYAKLNLEQSEFKVRPFSIENETPATISATAAATSPVTAATDTVPVKRPMFKPAFKKASE